MTKLNSTAHAGTWLNFSRFAPRAGGLSKLKGGRSVAVAVAIVTVAVTVDVDDLFS